MDNPASLPPYVDKGPGLLAVTWVEAGLGLLVLSARLYTRARIVRKVGWDDWTVIFAAILAVITSVIVTMEVHYGVGKHAAYIQGPDLIKAVEWIWLSAPFSTMSACFGKISIALLILRMVNRNKAYTIFLVTLSILLFIINLLLTIITFAECKPVAWLWDQLNPAATYHGSCWNPSIQKDYGYFQGSFSAFSDLLLALFPTLIIKDLKINLKLKVGLCVAMGLGIISTVAASVKTAELKNLSTPDFTYNAVNLVYWYISENWAIIIAACIPTLGPLYFIATGQRTKESFAAVPGRPSGSRSSRRSVIKRLMGWKLTSPIVRITDTSSGTEGKYSQMEKGLTSSHTSTGYTTSGVGNSKNGDVELMPIREEWQSSNIMVTNDVSIEREATSIT